MSRLAKRPIIILEKVKVELKDHDIEVTGPLGKLSVNRIPEIDVSITGGKIMVNRKTDDRKGRMLQGLAWSLIRNMVVGVTRGFKKELEIRGVGYQSEVAGNKLVLKLGFSHPVEYKIPEGIKIDIGPKGVLITVGGIDKQLVGETAAQIHRIKPPESYKGTGIRYVGEYVIKKAGKSAVSVTAGAGGKK
ncbi:MAG: 50S ribosomal protein L6 [Elusimicrobia bacterium CG1_02_37_114]|nr:MAG: 50S ribosomal protein L6 [Elusimicrobia bacterium CG1_02_37_114]PIV52553.1 MAG: 50S ribosomal protein L6 [Elusimicrobia bacterium CG02_land_8_20_14_3_00_37_13]PIZ13282.1 MAG: 50S ribosomal protein L6 [Elusimicrobia bacterium CG_4_10_14_0_8_um_filter_37_32]